MFERKWAEIDSWIFIFWITRNWQTKLFSSCTSQLSLLLSLLYMLGTFSNEVCTPDVETCMTKNLDLLVQLIQSFLLLKTSTSLLKFVWLPESFRAFSAKWKCTLLTNIFPVKVCVDWNDITPMFLSLFVFSFYFFPHMLNLSEWL